MKIKFSRNAVSKRAFDLVIQWGEYTQNNFHLLFIDGDLQVITSPDLDTFLRVTWKGRTVFSEDRLECDIYFPGQWLRQLWNYHI